VGHGLKEDRKVKLSVIQPVPFSEVDKPVESIFKENFKTMARDGTEVDVLWLKAGYSEPTHSWTESYNAVEMVKSCYRAKFCVSDASQFVSQAISPDFISYGSCFCWQQANEGEFTA